MYIIAYTVNLLDLVLEEGRAYEAVLGGELAGRVLYIAEEHGCVGLVELHGIQLVSRCIK